ncbi:MAG: YwqG family protein [Pseudomonadota bacterium]
MGNLVGLLALVVTVIVVVVVLRRDQSTDTSNKDYFAGKKPTGPVAASEVRDWPAIVKKAREVAETMARPAIALAMVKDPITDDAHSSIGGQPSLSAGAKWPKGRDGKPMIFLAQINFGDMPALDGYPETGLLSFFVEDNDLNGCDFPSRNNTGFLVVYHQEPNALQRHDLPDHSWEFTPFNAELTTQGRRLIGEAASGPISPNSLEGQDLTQDWYPDCPGELWDSFYEGLTKAKPALIYYGGHPDFTQGDFRRADDDPQLTEVLLQLGFVFDREAGVEICWGDAGEACFLISKADLVEQRFDKVAYNWDCS